MTIKNIESMNHMQMLHLIRQKLDIDLSLMELGNANALMDIIFRILKVEDLHIYLSGAAWEVWLDERFTAYDTMQNTAILKAILFKIYNLQ